ncbi:MAG TPA: PAS domain-containing sensor histidine kinase [Nitrosopumilaceae archaeon]|nr:PAS domain-containing sensor histidine kinase [Nitrosopumilaceae archaeon]
MNGKTHSKSNKRLDDLQIRSKSIGKGKINIIKSNGKTKENKKRHRQQLSQLQKSDNILTTVEQKYKNLYDSTPILLRTVTVNGIILDCNEAYAKALGYTKEEAIGKSIYDHTAERSIEAMKNNFKEWMSTKKITEAEIWAKRKDGSVFPTLLRGGSLYDEQGNLVGRTVALTDMTETYRAKKIFEENQKELHAQVNQLVRSNSRLKIAEQRYRTLYEKSPGLLRTISVDGIILDCNEAYARALGYTKEEAIGKSIFDHTAQISHKDMIDNVEIWKKTREISHLEIWMKRRDGSVFPVLMSGGTLYDENGNLSGRTVVLTDLTEIHETRKKLEHDEARIRSQFEELEKSHGLLSQMEQKYRTLYEKAPGLLRSITTEGVLTDCNETYAKALGYTKEEAIGKSFYDHTAERSIDDLRENLEAWKKNEQVEQKDIWMKRKDGSVFPAMLNGTSLYDENGNLIGRTVVLTDLTEIHETRNKLIEKENMIRAQYDELKKLDIAKEEFTSMISHELKTPLTPIMGWCQALKNPKIMGQINNAQSMAIDAILSNATKLRDLVTDMLDAQKLDMKKMKFDHKDVNVTEMLDFLSKNLLVAMEPKHIEFINSTKENLILKGDRSRLEQVLNNLILNAVDFVPANGGRIEMRAERNDDKVLFTVKDNGMGIPKDKQHHLFTQFYQLDTSATRKHGGSGLGLSICKGIVEALGGKIWLDSDTGKGTLFYFTIPIETKPEILEIEKQNQFSPKPGIT